MKGMSEKWTLAEGIEKLFADLDDPEGITDLCTEGRQLVLDVSFAIVEVTEYDGGKIEPTTGISVILTGFPPDDGEEHDEDTWMFSRVILPDEGEPLTALVQRIASGLGMKPDERIWEDADEQAGNEPAATQELS